MKITDGPNKDPICPACGRTNHQAGEDGAVDGPRQYHSSCWRDMARGEQDAAWENE